MYKSIADEGDGIKRLIINKHDGKPKSNCFWSHITLMLYHYQTRNYMFKGMIISYLKI